jgi:3-oxoacyl-[acyl-carrier protein] reductase
MCRHGNLPGLGLAKNFAAALARHKQSGDEASRATMPDRSTRHTMNATGNEYHDNTGGFGMQLGLRDKIFMVAGGSRGLGLGIASVLAEEGARVALSSRDGAAAERAAVELRERHAVQVHAQGCDVSDALAIERWSAAVLAEYGAIDGLVVNAGGPPPGGFDTLDDAAWEQAFQLTLMSAVRLIRAVLPALRQRGGGSILVLTSSVVKEPDNVLLLSSVMRAGVANLVKGFAATLARENIRINCLVPGIIHTDRIQALATHRSGVSGLSVEEQLLRMQAPIPMGRFGAVAEFGKAGAFLLSDAASYITGSALVVDGGTMRSI